MRIPKLDLTDIATIPLAVLLTIFSFVSAAAAGRNTPDVPLHHWSYSAVERLATAGLIDMSLLSTKPYSRRDFGRMTQQAIERARKRDFEVLRDTSHLQSLLYRLMDEYRPELIERGVEMLREDNERSSRWRYRLSDPTRVEFAGVAAAKDVTAAPPAKPQRSLFKADAVDWENAAGWRLEDGINVRASSRSWAEANPWGVFSVESVSFLSSDTHRLQINEVYARTSIGNVDVLAGRQSLWWGPGYHGAMLLSNNAQPLDLVRLSNRDPFHLPWVLRKLGPVRMNYFLAKLDADRNDFRHPILNGMRLELSPAPWASVGITRAILMGGRGRNPSFSEYLTDILFIQGENNSTTKFDPTNTDQKAGVDFRIRMPDWSRYTKIFREVEIYAELAGEDEAKFFGLPVPSNIGYVLGVYAPDIFLVPGLDLRLEYATTRVPHKPDVWYNHVFYTDGYTIKGRVIGHHMGTQADDLLVRLSKMFEDGTEMSAHFNLERHGVGLANAETKYEGHFELSYPLSESMQMSSFYRVQRFTNARNAPGESRTNHIFGLSVTKTF